MSGDKEQLYNERLKRYVAAMRNEKPDRIPIRPLAAEFCATYAGYTCQQVTHDLDYAFDAVLKCCADFDWDAAVSNMVFVWTGSVDAINLKYYTKPGIDTPADSCFQYLEPKDDDAHMKEDEYDALIEDPTGYLANVWMPRVSRDVQPIGEPSTYRNNMAWLKGGMSVLQYFQRLGEQDARMKKETGTVSAIAGCLKSPFDIIADKLRGYRGLCMDLFTQPEKVLKAVEALTPHMAFNALAGADPNKNVPITIWMHRGCVPFLSLEQFERFYWPSLKEIVEEIWSQGHQILFYAEGDWNENLKYFAELPEQSIIFHVDKSDVLKAHEILGEKFCLSGGIPNELIAMGTPEEVKDYCKKVIDIAAQDGGYIMDASAIMQDDAKIENVKAMTEFTREYGVY
ncbi:MAG: uroporphyrinogen decarboxylase family protein [Candidatus Hinthialibacter sp.]